MGRLLIMSFTLCLLAACTSISTSTPLIQTQTSSSTIQWQASELVTRCKTNTITDFRFILRNNGEWQSTAKLENTDLRKYRPYWKNHIVLKFLSVEKPAVTLDLFTEKMPAASVRTVEKNGVWQIDVKRFNDLHSATVTVEHNCEGLLEE